MSEGNLVIPKVFDDVVSKSPHQIALQIEKDNRWITFTYQEVKNQALKVAHFLLNEGLKKQDCVAIFLENRPEWPMIYLGIMYAGLTAVPVDVQVSPQDLKKFIIDSSTKILFCSKEVFNKKIGSGLQGILPKVVIVDTWDLWGQDQTQIMALPSVKTEDVASLIYTSGTTGIPKGVLLTHKNILANFSSIKKLNLLFPSDNFISLLPLHHTYPFMVTSIVPLFLGAKVTFCPLGFRPEQLANIIKEAEVTILVGVPQLFSMLHTAIFAKLKRIPRFLRFLFSPLLKHKIRLHFGRSLRLMISGGARLSPKIASDLKSAGFKIIEGYGLTETSPVVTFNPPQRVKFGSVGKPIPEVKIKIDSGAKLGVGEVLISGPNVMQGYFKQPELTASVIKEEWFHSGDLGYLDKDGYLFLTGRVKEVIILSSGKTVFPEELEEYYQRSPYIKEICILEKKELSFGHEVESLYAVVVPALEYFKEKKESNIEGKIRWELENLARDIPNYKHIMGFALSKDELPRTALKKIKRYQVREKFLEKKPAKVVTPEVVFPEEDLKLLNQDIAKKIIHYLSTQVNKSVSLDSHLEIDLGIDSLTRVELGLGLERLFSIKIPDETLYTISTVREVILKILEIMDRARGLAAPMLKAREKTWSQILKERPQEIILERIRLKAYLLDWLITCIIKTMLLFIFRICWLLKIKGKENLPQKGPFIISPNHASYLDGFVVFSSLPLRLTMDTYFLGYSAIFEHPFIGWAIKVARLIPVDPSIHLADAMQAVSYVLSDEKIVCIFPEGMRSIDAEVKEFRKGVGILLKELDVLVVPVYIKGSHYSWPRGRRLPHFSRLEIIFGKPCAAGKLLAGTKEVKDEYEAVAQGLREEVIKLSEAQTYGTE